jgi:hypothetical protein
VWKNGSADDTGIGVGLVVGRTTARHDVTLRHDSRSWHEIMSYGTISRRGTAQRVPSTPHHTPRHTSGQRLAHCGAAAVSVRAMDHSRHVEYGKDRPM